MARRVEIRTYQLKPGTREGLHDDDSDTLIRAYAPLAS